MRNSTPGLGVMIANLGGGRGSADAINGAIGKTISGVFLGDDEALHFIFEDGSKIKLFDDGQSCCESRYMRTDDDLDYFVGAQLFDADLAEAPDIEADGDYHEVQFLNIRTSKGVFTMSSHNKHNGYYGGFAIHAAVEK